MRILFIHSSNELYGADVVLLELLRHLDRERLRPQVLLPNDLPYEGLLARELAREGIPYEEMDLAVLRRFYLTPAHFPLLLMRLARATARLVRYIRRHGIELVHTNTSTALAGALAAHITGVTHVWHIHEIIHPLWLRAPFAWVIHRWSDKVVAVSQAVKEHLGEGDKVEVIHNGVDWSRFASQEGEEVRRQWGFTSQHLVVGMVGRVGLWKGQELFLRAAQRIAARERRARFVLVGGTLPGMGHQLQRLRALAQETGLGDKVVVEGFRHDMPQVYAAMDIFVLPSLRPDPFPIVVLEAMASGLPVVASGHGGAREMVIEGETGFLFPSGDADALADRVLRLLRDAPLRQRLGEAGRRRVIATFGLDRFVRRFQELYASLSEAKGASRR